MAVPRAPFAEPRRPTSIEIRRWQAAYREAGARQRKLIQLRPPNRRRAVAMSLDMLDAALGPGNRTVRKDAVRQREEAMVRETWRRLRSSLLHADAVRDR